MGFPCHIWELSPSHFHDWCSSINQSVWPKLRWFWWFSIKSMPQHAANEGAFFSLNQWDQWTNRTTMSMGIRIYPLITMKNFIPKYPHCWLPSNKHKLHTGTLSPTTDANSHNSCLAKHSYTTQHNRAGSLSCPTETAGGIQACRRFATPDNGTIHSPQVKVSASTPKNIFLLGYLTSFGGYQCF